MARQATPREPANADYDALFDLVDAPVVEVDGSGRVVRSNAAASRMLASAPREMVGRALDDLLGTDVTRALATAGPVPVLAHTPDGPLQLTLRSAPRSWRGPDGERFIVELHPEPTSGGTRRGNALHWSMMDDVSHNLGTPLSIIAGYAETLADRLDDLEAAQVREAAAAIHRHTTRAIDELRAIQARVRLTSGGAGTVPVAVLIAWLRRMLEMPMLANGTVLVARPEVDLVTLDVAVARQALVNVCTALLAGVPTPSVLDLRVTGDPEGNTSFTLLTDPPAPTLPEPARVTLEATATLLEQHGGRYERPSDGEPAHRVTLSGRGPAGDQAPPPTIPVAVIEDDPDTAALIRASLRNSAAVFDLVADERTFEDGLVAVTRTQPRIVLLDQVLPDRTGTAGIPQLRRAVPGAQVVVLSVRGPRDDDEVDDRTIWLEKGRVLADLGSELIGVLATTPD